MPSGKRNSTDFELISFYQLPKYLQDNEGIQHYYRPQLTFKQTISSLFRQHNELLNVWTHLLGSVLFMILMVQSLRSWLQDGEFMDKTVFIIFTVSAQTLLFLSSIFHLCFCMSKDESEYGWYARMDYIGISILISGSFYSPIYYTYKCMPMLMFVYNFSITVLALCCVVLAFHPTFVKPESAGLRSTVFVALASFGLVAFPPALFYFGFEALRGLIYRVAIMGALFLTGVVFYVSRYPECKYPGKFDCGLNSHVIWHFFVIGGALAQYYVCKYCYLEPQPCDTFYQ